MSDSLFRISQKAFIQNNKGEVLVVKERGRDWWDFPGGGLEYGETIREALVRELEEEAGYSGDFVYEIIGVEEPHLLLRDIWQVRTVYKVTPATFDFALGEDSDNMMFVDPDEFEFSETGAERLVCYYARKLNGYDSYDPHMPQREMLTKGL